MSMKLLPGQRVPPLTAGLAAGGSFDLAAETPETFTVVFFYRGLHCPICKRQLTEIAERLDGFTALGAGTIAVSMDSEERAREVAQTWPVDSLRIGYNLTADDAREWGLFVSKATKDLEPLYFVEPGTFVVKPDGTLYAQYLQSVPFARPRTDDLIAGLRFVIDHDYPIRGTVDPTTHER